MAARKPRDSSSSDTCRSLRWVRYRSPFRRHRHWPTRPVAAREPAMTDEVSPARRNADSTRGIRGCLTFGVPIAILLISSDIGTRYLVVVWPSLLTFLGVACLLNARRCGRTHCYVTGPFFLLLAGIALLYGIGVLPLGARGWSTLSLALVVGSVVLCCVPEWIFGRYRTSSHAS